MPPPQPRPRPGEHAGGVDLGGGGRPPLRHPRATIAVIVAMVVLPLLSIDLMIPALPPMARGLGASVALGQITLSVFAATFAAMHLIYGPLADRFGRRPFLIAGLILMAGASILAATAQSIETVLVARVLQGIGCATGPMLARAVVRDLWGVEGSGRLMGYLMAAFGLGAVSFPLIGGALVDIVGWRACFWFAAAFSGTTLVAALLFLAESAAPDREAIPVRRFVTNYGRLAADVRFIVVALAGCMIAACMFTWISGSSFVVQDLLGHSATGYALVYSSTVGAFVVSSVLSARLAKRTGSHALVAIGSAIAAAGGLLGIALSLSLPLSLPLLLLPIYLMTFGHGITLPQSMAASIVPFPHMAATASAMFGMFQYGIGAMLSVLNGLFFDGTALPMLAIIAVVTLTAATLYWSFRRRLLRLESV